MSLRMNKGKSSWRGSLKPKGSLSSKSVLSGTQRCRLETLLDWSQHSIRQDSSQNCSFRSRSCHQAQQGETCNRSPTIHLGSIRWQISGSCVMSENRENVIQYKHETKLRHPSERMDYPAEAVSEAEKTQTSNSGYPV